MKKVLDKKEKMRYNISVPSKEETMNKAYINILNCASQRLDAIADNSVDLIVTSPPYPMIEMWDECFIAQSPKVREALSAGEWYQAYEAMHDVLNSIWTECDRVLKDNGFVCINIGDATRTCDDIFRLFSNHSSIINFFEGMGYCTLPDIHWRKQTNAPNKFMGSGMYPAGAYVTYEHEYILIFRKGGKRVFKGEEVAKRRESAYFWEERNVWFSDLWEIKGTQQNIKLAKSRERSAAYPVEIPYRLVNMYSAYGDTVLDPFGGTGTTAIVCAALNRNCYIADIDPEMCKKIRDNILLSKQFASYLVDARIEQHQRYIMSLPQDKLEKCYINAPHGFLVKTRQEAELTLYKVQQIIVIGEMEFVIDYRLAECQSSMLTIKSPELALTE